MIRCRSYRHTDLSLVHEVECRSFDVPWSEKALAEGVDDPSHRAVVAEELASNHIVGYILIRTVLDEAEVLRVAVIPEYRGRQVASGLMTEALHVADEAGAEWAFLEVASGNAAALALYARFGFVAVGLRKGYYKGENGDALIMKKRLKEAQHEH